ncbi:MAG: AAA family ATPase [Shewanella sp.]
MIDCSKFTVGELRDKIATLAKQGKITLPEGESLTTVRQVWDRASCVASLVGAGLGAERLLKPIEPPSGDLIQLEAPIPRPGISSAIAAPNNADSGHEKALIDALRAITGQSASKPLDMSAVEFAIDERVSAAIASVSLPRKLEVVQVNREAVNVGLVHKQFDRLLKLATIKPNAKIWITGPSGSGKTHAAKQLAEALGRDFYSIGAAIMPSDLMGYVDANGKLFETQVFHAATKGGVLISDEQDSNSERATLAANEMLSGDSVVFGGKRYQIHPDFIMLAGANTWGNGATVEYTGRAKLDQAYINRFDYRIHWDYDESLEDALIGGSNEWSRACQKARKLAAEQNIKLLITPRHTQSGNLLFNEGYKIIECAEMTWGAGQDIQTLKKLGV